MSENECPACGMDGLEEMKYLEIKVKERVGCPFWDVVEPEGEICRINGIKCPELGEIWPDCCPLLCNDGVLVEMHNNGMDSESQTEV